jgi:N-acetylglucosaminyl-diphospho-decaprenol L-rhamnosyltransferase
MPDVSVIIVNWNTRDLLANCLNTLLQNSQGLELEIIVVDNASTDGSPEMLRRLFPQVQILTSHENVGFARANNQGMQSSRGRYTLLLNSDAFIQPGALRALVGLADTEPQAGLVGAQLLNPDGSFQASHTAFPTLWREFLILSGLGRLIFGPWYPSHEPEEEKGPHVVDYVEGACMLVRREAFVAVGGLDEDYFMYAEEVDWCYALREKGWQVWYLPEAKVIHLGSASSRMRNLQREVDLYRSRVLFFRRHYGERAANLLKAQIYLLTIVKAAFHGFLRFVSRGRYGRVVPSPGYLFRAL